MASNARIRATVRAGIDDDVGMVGVGAGVGVVVVVGVVALTAIAAYGDLCSSIGIGIGGRRQ